MIKHFVGILLLGSVSCFAGFIVTPVGATGPVSVDGTFTVDVVATSVTDLYAFQMDILFDPTAFSAVKVSEGSFLRGGGATFFVAGFIDNVNGKILNNGDTLLGAGPGVTGSGVLMQATFKVLKPGKNEIVLDAVEGLDSSVNDITPVTIVAPAIINAVAPEPATTSTSIFGLAFLIIGGLWRQSRRRVLPQ